MAKCDYCGTTILFGGVRDENLRFCNQECHSKGYALAFSREIPQDIVEKQVQEIHQGLCPRCQGRGPVDVHTSYRIHSLLLFTSWKTIPQISCRSCGIKSQIGSGIYSLILGWWGFPWGFLITPVQVIRNLAGVVKSPDQTVPSEKLENIIRSIIAQQIIEQHQTSEA